jgi:vacuolar-type H+-ATPase subunit I/STV1
VSERIVLSRFSVDNYLSYTGNQEIPQQVRNALKTAMELKNSAERAGTLLAGLEERRARLAGEQDRIRRNLEAAGNQTQQGMEYLRRMGEMDKELDNLASLIDAAQARVRDSQNAYDQYVASLSLL